MKHQQLLTFMAYIGPEKSFIGDGYYRIRENEQGQMEMAFLKSDGCGTTSVDPQITLEKRADSWQGVKLMNMAVAPTVFMTRDETNGNQIDQALVELINKFEIAVSLKKEKKY